jgi:hypothetical protein
MRTLLHLRTGPEDDLIRELITRQQALPDTLVKVVDLTCEPDYERLIEEVFAADSIQVS